MKSRINIFLSLSFTRDSVQVVGIGRAISVARRHPSAVRTQQRIIKNGLGTGVWPA